MNLRRLKKAAQDKNLRKVLIPGVKKILKLAMEKEARSLKIRQFQKLMNLSGKTFGVMSAYGPGSKSENQQRHIKLVQFLQKKRYKYVPLKGSWEGVSEKSLLIPNMKFRDLIALGKIFEQDSVIFKSPDGTVGMYFLKGQPRVTVAAKESGEPAFDVVDDKSLYSKSRGVSFEFGFLFGEEIPWDMKRPVMGSDLYGLAEVAA